MTGLDGVPWETILNRLTANPCCHLHNPDGCCDDDCGPCCARCPTCPRTPQPVLINAHEARQLIAMLDTRTRRVERDQQRRGWKGDDDPRPKLVGRYQAMRARLTVVVDRATFDP